MVNCKNYSLNNVQCITNLSHRSGTICLFAIRFFNISFVHFLANSIKYIMVYVEHKYCNANSIN